MGEWSDRAACRQSGTDAEWWWPSTGEPAGLALHICRGHCPVRVDCDRWAREQIVLGLFSPCVAGGHRYTRLGRCVRPGREVETSAACPLCPVGVAA